MLLDDDNTGIIEVRPGDVQECLASSGLVDLCQFGGLDCLGEGGAGGVARHQIYLGQTFTV